MEDTNVTPFPKEKIKKDDGSLVSSLSPREIVSELDRYVVGQNKAKKDKYNMERTGIRIFEMENAWRFEKY